ncbi:MAG TPA: hypothetical protein VK892_19415 [Pyrinomonadaceae bacterium]|nr:hypothetical protein [Pyrinomonadaceae bacterium]
MEKKNTLKSEYRKDERGAALVMVVLVSFLLLVASAGLLLEATMNTANVTDATADQQAYNAAESGIQSAINVLRRNVVPNPLFDATKPATDPANRIDFKKAVTLTQSNVSTDTGTVARLSRWINYNYKPSSVADWRVSLGSSSTYDPKTGYAFQLNITDPDNTANSNISYSTSGFIGEGNCTQSGGNNKKRICGDTNNRITIEYIDETVTNLNVSSGSANTRFGYFTFNVQGNGATISPRLRFHIAVNMTQPYIATKYIRGWIETGTMTNNSPGTVKITYESQLFSIMGSVITISCPNNGSCGTINTTVTDPTLKPPIVGFQVTPFAPNASNTTTGCGQGCTPVRGAMTPAEATRLLIRSTGFGPRGAKKILEAVIQKDFFNGMQAPATLTLVGPNSASNGSFVFNPGSSAAMQYSGDDIASNFFIPPIGTNNNSNLQIVTASVNGQQPHPFNGTVVGTPSDVAGEMPLWLQSPVNLDSTIKSLEHIANSSGRVFPKEDGSLPGSGNFGDNATAKGITFVNGDVSFTGSGGGILVVTGKLTLNGNFNFNGLIIVTGSDGIDRQGGGGGTLQGNVVIAPYNPNDLAAGFLAPKYDLSGGGNSDITYNSNSVQDGLVGVSNFVRGVAEK